MLKLVEPEYEGAPPRSQATMAFSRLRADIIAGRALPGEKLKINELAAQFEVSPGAVREALSRLVPEGFVMSREQKGFVVGPLSLEDLNDLTELRCEIEEIALRKAVAIGNKQWEAGVLTAAHHLRRTPMRLEQDTPNPAWILRHEDFHRALIHGCGSPRTMAMHNQLYCQAERYRRMSFHVEGSRNVGDEHQALVDAAMDRDADELVRLATSHLRLTTSLITEGPREGSHTAAR